MRPLLFALAAALLLLAACNTLDDIEEPSDQSQDAPDGQSDTSTCPVNHTPCGPGCCYPGETCVPITYLCL